MKIKPYLEYKDSGVKWIGKIPKKWDLKRLKHFTFNLDGKRIPISAENRVLGNIPYYGATGIVDYVDDYIFDEELLMVGEDGAPFFEFYKDVAFVVRGKCWVNNHAHILKVSKNFDINLLMHLLNQADYSLYIKGSTRDKLNQDQLKEIPIIEPSYAEQTSIVTFLNKKVSVIDKTIGNDTKLIELLKEKRTALINHVMTKGLDQEANMKDSGVKWIGEIPEGWRVDKLKYTSTISNDTLNKKPINLPYIGLEHIKSFTGVLLENDLEEVDSSVNLYKKGDILFGKLRPYLAKVIVAPFDGVCTTELIVFKVNNDNYNHFIFQQLLSQRFIDIVNSMTYGVKMPRANPYQIENMMITVPPIIEQKQIADYLENENSKIDETIQKIENKIKLMEEYKKSLIHHVVTGKFDVREVAV
jgi:restriction endonuclease S subunit